MHIVLIRTELGYKIISRNNRECPSYYPISTDSRKLTQYILFHGSLCPNSQLIEYMIALGVRLWSGVPEKLSTSELAIEIEELLLKHTLENKELVLSGISPFKYLSYYPYTRLDPIVEAQVNSIWHKVLTMYNTQMEEMQLDLMELDSSESKLLAIFVSKLLTKGIRYGMFAFQRNVLKVAESFDLVSTNLDGAIKENPCKIGIYFNVKSMKLKIQTSDFRNKRSKVHG